MKAKKITLTDSEKSSSNSAKPERIESSIAGQKPIIIANLESQLKLNEEVKLETAADTVPKQSLGAKIREFIKQNQYAIGTAIALALLLTSATFLYLNFLEFNRADKTLLNLDKQYLAPDRIEDVGIGSTLSIPEPEEPRTAASPINGVLFTNAELTELKKRLPVAAMVSNHSAARPQSNLTQADIVFETLVESGITRHMAIYWSNEVNKVGSIRSARQSYLEWLLPYEALYIHDGCAQSTDPRVDACGNIYRYGIHDISTRGAWREFDGVRVSPHNEYSSPISAWDYAETVKWSGFPEQFVAWKFKKDAKLEERGDKTEVSIIFHERIRNSGAYDVAWEYDKTTNTYPRTVGGKKDIDQENGQQVAPKTVIIQTTKTINTGDEKGHVIVEAIGSGDATFLSDGKIINGKWEKKSKTDRTRYFDSAGTEIQFNRGQIWVCVISSTESKFDIIDQ